MAATPEIVFTVSLLVDVPESLTDAVEGWLSDAAESIRDRLTELGSDSDESPITVHVDGVTERF